MMKKIIFPIACLMTMSLGLSACGNSSGKSVTVTVSEDTVAVAGTEAAGEDTNNAAAESESDANTAEATGESAQFIGLGNNPNNLYQSKCCMAFDEEFIYYANATNIFRMSHNGKNVQQIGSGGMFLNVYDGYLYYVKEGRGGISVCRTNLETLTEEVLAEYADYRTVHSYSMLVANDTVFLSYTYNYSAASDDYSAIDAISISDSGNTIRLFSSGAGDRGPRLTVSNDMLYALVKSKASGNDRCVYGISLSSLNSGQMEQLTQSQDYGMYETLIFTDNGVYLPGMSGNERYYYYRVFSEIKDPSQKFLGTQVGTSSFYGETTYTGIDSHATRFMLGSKMLILQTGTDGYGTSEAILFENFDFENGLSVGSVDIATGSFSSFCGVFQDVFYAVELPKEGEGSRHLVRIYADGTLDRQTIE